MPNTHHFTVSVESIKSRASVGNDLLCALGTRQPDGLRIHLDMKNPPKPILKLAPDTDKELAAFQKITEALRTVQPERQAAVLKAAITLLSIYLPSDT